MKIEMEAQKVLRFIQQKELVKLTCDLVDIPSPTGREWEVGEFVLNFFKDAGLETISQSFAPGRMNAIGLLPGSGGGSSLMFNSHMDTQFTGISDERMIMGITEPDFWPKALVKEGRIVGPGVVNDKGPLAAHMICARAIKRAGLRLKGDLIFAGVAGEIGRAPVGGYQGHSYCGFGAGTSHLLYHGITSDYVLVAEPSAFGITWALPGIVYLKITVYGQAVYAPYSERYEKIEESQNAIVKMTKVITALEEWGARYEKENVYEFAGGTIIPKVTIGAILGGLPFKPNYTASGCSIYMEVKIPPGKAPIEVKKSIEELLSKLGMKTSLLLFKSQRGYESKGSALMAEAVAWAYQQIFNKKPRRIISPATSSWNDLNIYHERGIPGVKFGPAVGRTNESLAQAGYTEFIKIEDLVNLSRIYALTAIKVCGQEK